MCFVVNNILHNRQRPNGVTAAKWLPFGHLPGTQERPLCTKMVRAYGKMRELPRELECTECCITAIKMVYSIYGYSMAIDVGNINLSMIIL